MVQYGDSTVTFSRTGDRHLRYPGKLRRPCTAAQKPRPLDENAVWKLMLQATLGLHHIHQLKAGPGV